jgi:hypothetical protein
MATIFLRARIWFALWLACTCAAPFYAQSREEPAAPEPQPPATSSRDESTRVVGIIPAFNTSNDVNAPALSPGEKFHLFSRTVTDPFNLIMPGVNAVILGAAGVSSGYGSGFGGVAKRYASSLADSTSGNFFRLYAYPAMLHEDPRYFRAASGSIGKRTGHVFAAAFITRKDEPSFRFNWSKLLASASSAGLSNAYYPTENRGWQLMVSRVGLSYATEIGTNALKEFWPDIARKIHKKQDRTKSASSDSFCAPGQRVP